jgi:hypothetical protein
MLKCSKKYPSRDTALLRLSGKPLLQLLSRTHSEYLMYALVTKYNTACEDNCLVQVQFFIQD